MRTLLPRFRPFTTWDTPATAVRRAGPSPVEYTRLIDDILRELVHLGAYRVVVSTAHDPREIRLDGWPRASAKKPAHPGVSLAFYSNYGPLAFASDTYDSWQANLRAITVTLENLRTAGSGAQYRRYAALPPPEPEQTADPAREGATPSPDTTDPPANPREAAAKLLLAPGGFEVSPKNIRLMVGSGAHDASERGRVWRAAVKAAHPDRNAGEGHEAFLAMQAAYELLCG